MFKNYFFLGILSGLFSTLIAWVYASVYAKNIIDFSEAIGLVQLLTFSMMVTVGACIVNALIALVLSKNIGQVIFNVLFSGVGIALVFMALKQNDPEFKNEDAQLMIESYKGFLMPIIFIPLLSYFSFKPLFVK